MGKNIAKNIGTSLSRKYSQKCFDHAKKSATYALITSSKKIIKKKTAEATSDLFGNKIAGTVTKVSKKHNKTIQKQLKKA